MIHKILLKSKTKLTEKQPMHFQKNMLIRGGSASVPPYAGFESLLTTFVSSSVSGGLLSGGLHAISGALCNQTIPMWYFYTLSSGPDHLAALIPSSIGRPALNGIHIGAIWGLGHGLSAMTLGLCGFFLKGRLTGQFQALTKLSDLAETAVGVSLLLIGIMGIHECRGTVVSTEKTDPLGINSGDRHRRVQRIVSLKALFLNGLVHGLSLDGAPSLVPAMAMTSWIDATRFLLAYCAGTMLAMSIAAGSVGELSMRIGRVANNPDLSRQLSLASSVAAVIIGLYWILKALLLRSAMA
jgi:hypothetical protein